MPHVRLHVARWDALPGLVHVPEIGLRPGDSLVRRQPIPPHGHGIVLRVGAEAEGVPEPEVEPRQGAAAVWRVLCDSG